jgi:hypothetical protein
VFAVSSTHAIWEQGEQIGAADLVTHHPELGWVRWSAGEGSQGPRRYDWAWMRLPYASAPGMAHWLLIRRSLSLPEEYAYYRVYAPQTTSLPELIAVAGQRWQIESAFEAAKGEVGLAPLTPAHWDQIAPLLPAERTAGRPYCQHHQILEGMLWVMTTGTSWRQLPSSFGPWETVYYRFQRWKREGLWEQIRRILLS